ncbi:MAG TPA: ADP-ribosylglycohydrolase family protein [Blastocatellia bacterium]
MDLADKVEGCILGGALGDGYGRPFEGTKGPVRLHEVRRLVISDDTQMTLATCEAITEQRAVSPKHIAANLAAWYQAGRITNVGSSTHKALSELIVGGHWALTGRKGEMAAGNGAAMRIAPLAFCLDPSISENRRILRDVCRITHHSEEAYAGALAIAIAIRAACQEAWSGTDSLIELVAGAMPDTSVRDRLNQMSGQPLGTPIAALATRFGSSGYVVDSVPLALAGAERLPHLGFEAVLAHLVSAGGDTDTIASMAGQVMGALIGKSKLPIDLLQRLDGVDSISAAAAKFATAVQANIFSQTV